MTAEERCELTELVKSACAHCRPKPPAFEALYKGGCPVCERMIVPGQMIRDPGDGNYTHERCS